MRIEDGADQKEQGAHKIHKVEINNATIAPVVTAATSALVTGK